MLLKIGTTTCLMLLFDFVKCSTYRVVTRQTETDLICDKSLSIYTVKECSKDDTCAPGPDAICKHFHTAETQRNRNLEAKCPSRGSYTCPFSEFSPICLRCAICVAIVEKFDETFIKAHRIIYHQNKLKDVKQTLRSTCDCSFVGYEFRNLSGFHVVTNLVTGTKHIPSHLDGKWKERLSKFCNEYLDISGEYSIYDTWLADQSSLLDTICRGGGLLRDCSNIPVERISLLVPVPRWHLTTSRFIEMHKLVACP